MSDSAYEDLAVLQDVLDEVVNGRVEGHKCPFCGKGKLECSYDDPYVHIECPSCGRTFDGTLG